MSDYIIHESNSAKELRNIVTYYLSQGWQLQGGVSIAIDQGRQYYTQAMVK